MTSAGKATIAMLALSMASSMAGADGAGVEVSRLRLVPFPREVASVSGWSRVRAGWRIAAPASPAARRAADDLAGEIRAAMGVDCSVEPGAPCAAAAPWELLLGPPGAAAPDVGAVPPKPEAYALAVTPNGIAARADGEAGLLHAARLLRQLFRANLRRGALPCLRVRDFPALRLRGTQDDITRGPSPRLGTLEREAAVAAYLGLNFLTYYLEHQFRFAKHPEIGPPDGSLEPAELRALVDSAAERGVEIIGCQQSFGHFGNILRHPDMEPLRETPDILNPMNEASYRLLDDLYSEQAPLLRSRLFNVCCDETYGLGTGPSKALADRIGVGGVYVRHIQRVHDILRDHYGKRMMMWGDIILQHPERIPDVPRDTVLLSWGYHAGESFDDAIVPFVRAGFEFLVCPGTSNWSRILPDFATAEVNIRNYVRDGVKHGALGTLNTIWNDDGETLFATNWAGVAWGAECAWTGSATAPDDFRRRLGGVLFGDPGERFGRALALLARTHAMPGYDGMMDARFWRLEPGDADEGRARKLLAAVEPAIAHLRACRRGARVNAGIVDHYLFGAERMRHMARREIALARAGALVQAARERWQEARPGADRAGAAVEALLAAEALLRPFATELAALRAEYARLWQSEKKPHGLDRILARYDSQAATWSRLLADLRTAAEGVRAGEAPPRSGDVGLPGQPDGGSAAPRALHAGPLAPEMAWVVPGARRRMGLALAAADADRMEAPVELALAATGDACALREIDPRTGAQTAVVCQWVRSGRRRALAFVAPGVTPAGAERRFLLYLGARDPAPPADRVTLAPAAHGGRWIANADYRILLGPEGGHLYRWEARAAAGRDVTEPGETGWAGFADVTGPHRAAPNRIEVLASGPALARVRCSDPTGLRKTFTFRAGVPWVTCAVEPATSFLSCYDDIDLMGAASATPGVYLLSDGQTGPLRPLGQTNECQAAASDAWWGAKCRPGGPMLALLTPDMPTRHVVGPGSGMGGVVVEGGRPAARFVIYVGETPSDPARLLEGLRAALRGAAEVDLWAAQDRPAGGE
ncbi:MAG: family 20 glycosylhydrolase [Chthonomonadales bacterium]|nr:family 20 glycosylhydrolase [Chthonomonadales bacterium]